MKRFITLMLIATFITTVLSFNVYGEDLNNASILQKDNMFAYIGGFKYSSEPAVVQDYGNITYAPARLIAEVMWATVEWNEESLSATLRAADKAFVFKADSSDYTVNGKQMKLNCPAILKNDRLSLPLKDVCEVAGLKTYNWGNLIVIYSGDIITYDELSLYSEALTSQKAAYEKQKAGDWSLHPVEIR